MGSPKDTMELFVERDLRQFFPLQDGWKISSQNGSKAGGLMYRISRYKWNGDEIALVGVSFEETPADETFSALDTLSNGNSKAKKYVLAPQAADISYVPPHIRVLRMNAFAVSDGKLVWLTKKKNAKKFSFEAAVPA